MGQQQLLLIVLGIIVVGIAIVVGINMFSTSAREVNRDLVISVLTSLSTDVQAYYIKETQFGGGGGTYKGWQVPAELKRHESGKRFVKATVRKNRVILTGYGTEKGRNGRSPVRVRSIIRPTGFRMQIKN